MIYIVFLLVGVLIALAAFIGGFMFSIYFYPKQDKKALTGRTKEKKAIPELTEEQKRELRKKQIEIQNFFNYAGDVMPNPNEKKYESTAKGD